MNVAANYEVRSELSVVAEDLVLESAQNWEYFYCVVWLEVSGGNAPAWRIRIASDFNAFTVERIQ
jgi:hypothetical protein